MHAAAGVCLLLPHILPLMHTWPINRCYAPPCLVKVLLGRRIRGSRRFRGLYEFPGGKVGRVLQSVDMLHSGAA